MMFVDQKHAQYLGRMAAFKNEPETSCLFEPGSWMAMHWLRSYRFERNDVTPVEEVAYPNTSEPEIVIVNSDLPLSFLAKQKLQETDHIEFRTPTADRTPSAVWLAWREQLREVARGNLNEIPEEPVRYVSAP